MIIIIIIIVHIVNTVVVVFGVCWLPYHVYFLCTYQWPQLVSAKATQHIYLAIYWLAMSNSMLNPIILILMNRRYELNIYILIYTQCITQ